MKSYAEVVALRDALWDSLLNGGGATSITIGDRQISYGSTDDMFNHINQLNRTIQVYDRRTASRNPYTIKAKWTRRPQ